MILYVHVTLASKVTGPPSKVSSLKVELIVGHAGSAAS